MFILSFRRVAAARGIPFLFQVCMKIDSFYLRGRRRIVAPGKCRNSRECRRRSCVSGSSLSTMVPYVSLGKTSLTSRSNWPF